MKNFMLIEKYISLFKERDFGKWNFPKPKIENGQEINFFPYVSYSDTVLQFLDDYYKFYEDNDDIYNEFYEDILNRYGLYKGKCNFDTLNLSLYNAHCIGAIIFCIIRNDRFCEGFLLKNLENGVIVKCLKRLKDIARTEAKPIIKPLRMKFDVDLEHAFRDYNVSPNSINLKKIRDIILDTLLKTPKKKVYAHTWHDEIPKIINPEDPLPTHHFVETTIDDDRKYITMYSSIEEFRKQTIIESAQEFGIYDFCVEASNDERFSGIIINPVSEVKMIFEKVHLQKLLDLYAEMKQKGLKTAYQPQEKHYEKIGKDEITLQEAVVIAQNKAVELGAKLNPTMTICADGWACYFHNGKGRCVADEYQHFITQNRQILRNMSTLRALRIS